MDNLFQFLDKILPLISTLLGAYITYFVTVSSKKSELKVNAQTKARDEYWIPCSIAISSLSIQSSKNAVFSRLFAYLMFKPYVFSLVFALMSQNKGNFFILHRLLYPSALRNYASLPL